MTEIKVYQYPSKDYPNMGPYEKIMDAIGACGVAPIKIFVSAEIEIEDDNILGVPVEQVMWLTLGYGYVGISTG